MTRAIRLLCAFALLWTCAPVVQAQIFVPVPIHQLVSAAPSVTWNPATATATLSGGNLTASTTGANFVGAVSTTSHTTGKYYAEIEAVSGTGASNGIGVGVATTAFVLNMGYYLGEQSNAIGYYNTGQAYYNNSAITGGTSFGDGTTIGIAEDGTGNYWFTYDCVHWNAGGTASPVGTLGAWTGPTGTLLLATVVYKINSGIPTTTINATGPFTCSSLYTTLTGAGYTHW